MKYLKDDGSIKKSGIEAILEAVSQCMRLAEEYEITQLLVMATSALREAPNGNKVIRKIEELIGQGVTVLSGTDEARLTFLAARRWYGWDAGRLLVLDIGGGSLEVAMGSDEEPTVALSAPAGAGRVTTEFLPSGMATPDELEDVRKNVRKILEPMVKVFPQFKHPNHAVGHLQDLPLAGSPVRCGDAPTGPRRFMDYDDRAAGRLDTASCGDRA